jgi:hypothetical protein
MVSIYYYLKRRIMARRWLKKNRERIRRDCEESIQK